MKVTCYETDHPWISIEDFYDKNELELIWKELDFLCDSKKLHDANSPEVGAASKGGNILKQNSSIFLDFLYYERKFSNILTTNRKIINCVENNKRKTDNWFFKHFTCEDDFTLLSYYEDSDYYKPHTDSAAITTLTWLYKEPKRFTGGDLIFPNTKEIIECKNNRVIIFPSVIWHQVTEVKMNEQYNGKGMGRWCITQFLHNQKIRNFNNRFPL